MRKSDMFKYRTWDVKGGIVLCKNYTFEALHLQKHYECKKAYAENIRGLKGLVNECCQYDEKN